jgi:pilus assembly protein CpaE
VALSNRVLLLSADGQTGTVIADALQRGGISVAVAHDLGSALLRLADAQLIILDARDAATLAMLCRRINDEAGSRHPPILAVAHGRDVEERVQLLEAGADDVLAQPIDETELEALVEALMLRAPAAAGSGVPVDGNVPRPVQTSPGRVIAFAAAKGGSGTTTLAVNTALVLAEMAPGSVAIADLDMFHGQVSTHLDIYARSSTAQLAREERSGPNAELIQDAGKQHASGLVVFGGPYRSDEAFDVTAAQLAGLVDALRMSYGTVIIDAGSTIDMRALAVLERAERVVMPITPDIPSLRLLHAALQLMSETASLTDHTMFVLNNIYPKATIAGEQIEEHLGIRISLDVPYDGENFLRAVNEGQPLMTLARRSQAASAIKSLAELTAETRLEDDLIQPQRRGRFRGLLGRS